MSKKDYIAIGWAVRGCLSKMYEHSKEKTYVYISREELIDELSEVFKKDNSLFNKQKFVEFVNQK